MSAVAQEIPEGAGEATVISDDDMLYDQKAFYHYLAIIVARGFGNSDFDVALSSVLHENVIEAKNANIPYEAFTSARKWAYDTVSENKLAWAWKGLKPKLSTDDILKKIGQLEFAIHDIQNGDQTNQDMSEMASHLVNLNKDQQVIILRALKLALFDGLSRRTDFKESNKKNFLTHPDSPFFSHERDVLNRLNPVPDLPEPTEP